MIMEKTKKRWKTILFYFFVFILFLYSFLAIHFTILDCYWNYGVAYNIANGLLPYRDFNLLTLPLAPMIMSIFFKLFTPKMIVFFILNSICMTLIVFLSSKLEKSTTLIVLFILINFGGTSYNLLILIFILLLLLLEKNKKNDFLIGIIVGLSILTKQVLVLLIIPMLIGKKKNSIIKRIMGLIIPAQFFLLYLIKNDIFIECLDYALFGIFDFGGNNSNLTIYTIIGAVAVLYLLWNYIKTKNILYLYAMCFMIIAAPLFDRFHLSYASIPLIILCCGSKQKIERFVNILFSNFILLFLVLASYNQLVGENIFIETNYKSNYFLVTQIKGSIEYGKDISAFYYKNIEEYDIYFIDDCIYYVKLKYNIPINKFDMVLYGNNGFNGNKKLIDEIKNMNEKTLFLIDERFLKERKENTFLQTNFELMEFVANNYKKVGSIIDGYNVYEIVNE